MTRALNFGLLGFFTDIPAVCCTGSVHILDLATLQWTRHAVGGLPGGVLTRHVALSCENQQVCVLGGGGSCFSFGTIFSPPLSLDLAPILGGPNALSADPKLTPRGPQLASFVAKPLQSQGVFQGVHQGSPPMSPATPPLPAPNPFQQQRQHSAEYPPQYTPQFPLQDVPGEDQSPAPVTPPGSTQRGAVLGDAASFRYQVDKHYPYSANPGGPFAAVTHLPLPSVVSTQGHPVESPWAVALEPFLGAPSQEEPLSPSQARTILKRRRKSRTDSPSAIEEFENPFGKLSPSKASKYAWLLKVPQAAEGPPEAEGGGTTERDAEGEDEWGVRGEVQKGGAWDVLPQASAPAEPPAEEGPDGGLGVNAESVQRPNRAWIDKPQGLPPAPLSASARVRQLRRQCRRQCSIGESFCHFIGHFKMHKP